MTEASSHCSQRSSLIPFVLFIYLCVGVGVGVGVGISDNSVAGKSCLVFQRVCCMNLLLQFIIQVPVKGFYFSL